MQQLTQGQEAANSRAVMRARIAAAALSLAERRLAEARRQIDALIDSLEQDPHADRVGLGLAWLTAARIADSDGGAADAEQRARRAISVYEKLAIDPAASADVGEALLELAKAQQQQGRPNEAADTARRALTSLTAGLGPDHASTREAAGLAGTSS